MLQILSLKSGHGAAAALLLLSLLSTYDTCLDLKLTEIPTTLPLFSLDMGWLYRTMGCDKSRIFAFVVAVVLGCARVSTAASVSGSSSNNADPQDVVASRPMILSGIMDHLQSTSRRLRDSGTDVSDAFGALEEVRDIAVASAQTWQTILEAIQSKDRGELESFVRVSTEYYPHLIQIELLRDPP